MILTVTMNPAIDKTLSISNFQINHVNRVSSVRLDAAGKGINVSKVVKKLGGRTKTFAFLGGENGRFIEKDLEKNKIGLVKVSLDEETRVNTKIVDEANQTFTDINEMGPSVPEAALLDFKRKLYDFATSQSVLVLSGSVPPGVPVTIYKELILRYKQLGVLTVLDADGDLLKLGLEAIPYMIKPNRHELERHVGYALPSVDAIITACDAIIKQGVVLICVSLGEAGALFITEENIYRAYGVQVEVKSTVGAGDALLAGMCYGLSKQIPLVKTIELAVATSAAKVMTAGTGIPNIELIQEMTRKVKIERIKKS